MESKLLENLKKLEAKNSQIKAYLPGNGFRLCKITKINGDIVTVQLSGNKKRYSLHYTAMVIERTDAE